VIRTRSCEQRRIRRASLRDERGDAMVVWCLLFAVMLLPLGGLSVDLWHGITVQRQLQSAAEDAALAGSSGIDVATYRQTGCIFLDPGAAVALAQQSVASQQGLGDLTAATFQVDPPGQQISVTLQKRVSLTLLALVLGGKSLLVSATAVSAPAGSLSGRGCAGLGAGGQ